MSFTSTTFLLLLVPVLLLYWALRHSTRQNVFLLAASYGFYMYWDWRFLALILATTASAYVCGIGVATGSKRRRKAYLVAALVLNLGLLAFFKYYGFFADNVNRVAESVGLASWLPALNVILPVGISFYTFQALSYVVDAYRADAKPRRNLLDVALYVAYFPQLVAGPIERATHLLPQLERPRTFDPELAQHGFILIAWGLFKKVVIADHCAGYVEAIYGSGAEQAPFSGEVLVATYAFALQIYCDFSAYSDIARGIAAAMGIRIILNFDKPYLAASIREFWQRWHISLSTWIRDYLYIPLGGNRHGTARNAITLYATMLLMGLWHGANWTFVIWGGLHATYIWAERVLRSRSRSRSARGSQASGAWRGLFLRPLRVLLVFHLVCLSWIVFRAENIDHLQQLLYQLFQFDGWGNGQKVGKLLLVFAGILGLGYVAQWLTARPRIAPVLQPVAWVVLPPVLLVLAWLFGSDTIPPFIYFQF